MSVGGNRAVVSLSTSRDGFVVAVVRPRRSNPVLGAEGTVVACESLSDNGERTASADVEEKEKGQDKRNGACALCAREHDRVTCLVRIPPWIFRDFGRHAKKFGMRPFHLGFRDTSCSPCPP